jgi:ribosome-associated heat shock protein Hsp15
LAKYRPGSTTQTDSGAPVPPRATLRIDKWLWQARFFKSRTLAADMISLGHMRINGQRSGKSSVAVGPGDVLTFPQGSRIRLIRVASVSDRRGPASEAQAMYVDLDAPSDAPSPLE